MANTTYQVTLSLDGAHTISVTNEPAQNLDADTADAGERQGMEVEIGLCLRPLCLSSF